MIRIARLYSCLGLVGAAVTLAACGRDSGAPKAESASVADSAAARDSAAAANSPGTLEGPSANVDSAHPPAGSTEGTIGETRTPIRPTDRGDRPRDSAIAGPYKTIDSVGRIRK